jgi:hypothetical protein
MSASTEPSPSAGQGPSLVTSPSPALPKGRLFATRRTDRWWVEPLVIFVILSAFVLYATWRAFANKYYYIEPYQSPFYSPCVAQDCIPGSDSLGRIVGGWYTLSPALLILIFPLGFRFTCYYYRRSYYRAFWVSPPACAVAEPHPRNTGESRWPLLIQNSHRLWFYFAMAFNVILTWDAVLAFRAPDGSGYFHMGLGSLVLTANAAFLWLYTLSCHSCRNAIGGRLRHFSKHPIRYRLWTWVSRLNIVHSRFAWASLFSVALADFYVYGVASGLFSDPRFF